MAKLFIVYDERAVSMGTDEASVCCTASTLNEARRDVRSMFHGCPIYSYDMTGPNGELLVNEHLEEYKPLATPAPRRTRKAGRA